MSNNPKWYCAICSLLLSATSSANATTSISNYFQNNPQFGTIVSTTNVLESESKTRAMFDIQTGPGKHNHEQQIYKSENFIVHSDGSFTLKAQGENPKLCQDKPCSARVKSSSRYSIAKSPSRGVVEVTAKVPDSKGWWPAIWLLPEGFTSPKGGEIDMVEVTGKRYYNQGPISSALISTIHYGQNNEAHNWSGNGDQGFNNNNIPMIYDMVNTYHNYAYEWNCQQTDGACDMTWYLDGVPYYQISLKHGKERTMNESGAVESIDLDGWHHEWGNPSGSNTEKAKQSFKNGFRNGFYFVFNIAGGGDLADGMPDKRDKTKMDIKQIKLYALK